MAVTAAPTTTPSIGFSKSRKRFLNSGTFANPSTAFDMVSIPNISVAKPSKIVPVSLLLLDFKNIVITMPKTARTGVNEVGFKSFTKRLSPSIPASDKIQAVTVVPMFAPIITFIAWRSFITPELTKPTTITVVAEEL